MLQLAVVCVVGFVPSPHSSLKSAPKVITKQISPEKAQELKERLEAVGAQIELD